MQGNPRYHAFDVLHPLLFPRRDTLVALRLRRPGARRDTTVTTLEEAFTAVATGTVVSPIGADAAASRRRSDLVFLPITDGPVLRYAPVWRTAGETALVRAFVQAARDAQESAQDAPV